MRKLLALAALLLAVSLPSVASAQIFLGARVGYGIPWGDVMKDWAVKDSIRAQVPITLDLGLKLGKALAVGAYASYGFDLLATDVKDSCDADNSDCSAGSLRVGAQLNLHASNTETTEFWGGIAVGYEQLRLKDSKASIDEVTFQGYDFTLQGGFDFLASSDFRIGPFASASVGRFTTAKSDAEVDITSQKFHGFLLIGVRGFYTL